MLRNKPVVLSRFRHLRPQIRRRVYWRFLSCLFVLAIYPGWFLWHGYHQQQLNQSLLHAIRQSKTDEALRALENGADAKTTAPFAPVSPLHFLRDRLIGLFKPGRGVSQDQSYSYEAALPLAVDNNNTRVVHALLQRGANPNGLSLCCSIDEPLLRSAVDHDNLEMVRALLDSGADLNSTDAPGDTPLMAACHGKGEVARLLLARGAGCSVSNRYGGTPLTYAIDAESADVVALLIHYGADVNAETYGQTPLMRTDYLPPSTARLKIRQLLKRAGAKK